MREIYTTKASSFNPCFDGSVARGRVQDLRAGVQLSVSILVLMEV